MEPSIINLTERGHHLLIQQRQPSSGSREHAGMWWVNCGSTGPRCNRIICRIRPFYDSWCETEADARALATWHANGEHGPAPTSGTPTATPTAPVQLDLFA